MLTNNTRVTYRCTEGFLSTKCIGVKMFVEEWLFAIPAWAFDAIESFPVVVPAFGSVYVEEAW